jgi:hypothetical protein
VRAQKAQNQSEPSISHLKAMKLIERHASKRQSGLITFPEVRKILSWLYHLNRSESKQFLMELKFLGLIYYHPYHGIKIREGTNDEK